MGGKLTQNNSATPTALFVKAADMMSTTANMSAMEYEMDIIGQLVINLIGDFQAASGTISEGTQARLANLNQFMQYCSINFVLVDENSPLEDWKIPYGVSLKAQVRDIQTWYLSTKLRIFGN